MLIFATTDYGDRITAQMAPGALLLWGGEAQQNKLQIQEPLLSSLRDIDYCSLLQGHRSPEIPQASRKPKTSLHQHAQHRATYWRLHTVMP